RAQVIKESVSRSACDARLTRTSTDGAHTVRESPPNSFRGFRILPSMALTNIHRAVFRRTSLARAFGFPGDLVSDIPHPGRCLDPRHPPP
ncbi:MAG: hypothetical protein ACAI43_08925, partial [Phycisphaerae bacterium]